MKNFLLFFLLTGVTLNLQAQKERKMIRQGVKDYQKENYTDAEIDFRSALVIDSTSDIAEYNVAGTLYKQEKYRDAQNLFLELTEEFERPEQKADAWHNLGNSLLLQKNYPESIEAYKNALRIRPDDHETRYNLAYAKAMLENQQNKQNQQDQNNQDQQDQQNNQNQQDQNNQDQQQNREQQQQRQDQQQQDRQSDEQNAQPQKQLSEEDMQRILQAIQQQEENVREKLEKQKEKATKTKTEKDW